MVDVILLASGKSERMGIDKMLLPIGDDLCLTKLVELFSSINDIKNIYIVIRDDLMEIFECIVKKYTKKTILHILGGETRSQSVYNAIKEVDSPYVLIHDAARPFVSLELINRCIDTLYKYGSAIPILQISDSLRIVENDLITDFVDRSKVFAVQTPQGFKTSNIKKAFNLANGENYTDESELYKRYIKAPSTFLGEDKNKKITTIADYININSRVGFGFDVHKLAVGESLILGGVNIPHYKGTVAHSDGDVVYHSVIDAIFSAMGERDIGYHFPDTDERFKNIDSGQLLSIAYKMMLDKNYKIYNLSITIMAEKPKINPFIDEMKMNLAKILNINVGKIGINATSTENLGIIGEEKGIAVNALITLI